MRRPSTGILTSFWYYAKYDFDRIPEQVPLILDSGAFSAYTSGGEVVLEDYATWARGLEGRYDFAFNLDVLGDAEASFVNWTRLRSLGVDTSPVIHYGDRPEDVLPRYISEGATRLSLGGIAVSGAGAQVQAWCAYVFRWLRDNVPDLHIHGLGVHMRSKLARFPWTSTDSSSFTSAWRFARLSMWDFRPGKGRWTTVPLDGRTPFKYGSLIRLYGEEPENICESTPDKREALVRLATRIECRAADDWNARLRGETTDRYVTTKPSVYVGGGLDTAAGEIGRYLVNGGDLSANLNVSRYLVDTYPPHLEGGAGAITDRYLATTTGSGGLRHISEEIDRT